jgi:hypothetical protein
MSNVNEIESYQDGGFFIRYCACAQVFYNEAGEIN